jgi:hypothetical protein
MSDQMNGESFERERREERILHWLIECPDDRFHGTYPPNYNEGTHLITGKRPTQLQVVPKDF